MLIFCQKFKLSNKVTYSSNFCFNIKLWGIVSIKQCKPHQVNYLDIYDFRLNI